MKKFKGVHIPDKTRTDRTSASRAVRGRKRIGAITVVIGVITCITLSHTAIGERYVREQTSKNSESPHVVARQVQVAADLFLTVVTDADGTLRGANVLLYDGENLVSASARPADSQLELTEDGMALMSLPGATLAFCRDDEASTWRACGIIDHGDRTQMQALAANCETDVEIAPDGDIIIVRTCDDSCAIEIWIFCPTEDGYTNCLTAVVGCP